MQGTPDFGTNFVNCEVTTKKQPITKRIIHKSCVNCQITFHIEPCRAIIGVISFT